MGEVARRRITEYRQGSGIWCNGLAEVMTHMGRMISHTTSAIGGARTPQFVEGIIERWRRSPTRGKGPGLVLNRKEGVAKLRDEERRGSKCSAIASSQYD